MESRIIFKGREYRTPDEMPAEVRKAYTEALARLADRDGNGVPDLLERRSGGAAGEQRTTITINGKPYDHADRLPADVRTMYDGVMRGLDQDRNGIPDVFDAVRPADASDPIRTTVHREIVIDVSGTRSSSRTEENWLNTSLKVAAIVGAVILLFALFR